MSAFRNPLISSAFRIMAISGMFSAAFLVHNRSLASVDTMAHVRFQDERLNDLVSELYEVKLDNQSVNGSFDTYLDVPAGTHNIMFTYSDFITGRPTTFGPSSFDLKAGDKYMISVPLILNDKTISLMDETSEERAINILVAPYLILDSDP